MVHRIIPEALRIILQLRLGEFLFLLLPGMCGSGFLCFAYSLAKGLRQRAESKPESVT